MSLAIAGNAPGNAASGTTCVSDVFSSAPVVGRKIYVGVGWFNDTPLTVTLTDNASGGTNTYAPCGAAIQSGSTDAVRWFVATVDRTNAAFQVTATFSGDGGTSRITCVEVSGGAGAVDIYGGQFQAPGVITTDGTTTGALGTPSVDGCIVLAMSRSVGWPDNYAAGTGYTPLHDINLTSRTYSEYLVQTTKTAVASTFTQDATTSTLNVAVVIAPENSAAAIPGKTVKSQYNEPEDLSFVSSSKLTKPQPGGAAPQGASKLGKVFQSQFNDILGFDFISSSKQTRGLAGTTPPPGAAILGKSFVNNPAPNPELEWDFANGVSVGSASPGGAAPSTTAIPVPKTISNVLFVDSINFTEFQSRVVKGQPGNPPIIGLPRYSIMSKSAVASQMIDDETMFLSRFGVKNSHPAGGTIPAPPVTNVISNIGLVGAGTMRGV